MNILKLIIDFNFAFSWEAITGSVDFADNSVFLDLPATQIGSVGPCQFKFTVSNVDTNMCTVLDLTRSTGMVLLSFFPFEDIQKG